MTPSSVRCDQSKHTVLKKLLIALVLLLALLSFMQIDIDRASADVRKTDIVTGDTVENRGLKASICPSVEAEYIYLLDSNGKVYFERNAEQSAKIASITKIMTAIIAIENADLDTEIHVSSNAVSAGGSIAGLWAGDTLKLDDALKALMIPSGNDAAIAIAETLGKAFIDTNAYGNASEDQDEALRMNSDALDAFVDKMNRKASELGCVDTLFENPHGLDYGQFQGDLHSNAKEVSKIASYAMKIDTIRNIVDMESADIPVQRNGEETIVTVKTTDELLGRYEGACGIKTGATDLAGPCLAGACERNGLTLYAIILNSTSSEQRFLDATNLYNWVYNNTVEYRLADSDVHTFMNMDGEEKEVPVIAYASLRSWLDKTVPITLKDPDRTIEVFALDGNVSQEFDIYELNGSVRQGDVVGKVYYYQHNERIAESELIACESIDAPNIVESFSIWWSKVLNSLSGAEEYAQSVIINKNELLIER